MAELATRRGASSRSALFGRLRHAASRLWVRLLVIHVVVLLVPMAGIEFARLYERRLLHALERDMEHQAVIVAETLARARARGESLDHPGNGPWLERIARRTRARIRVLDTSGHVVADSHARGAPEGPEPGATVRSATASRSIGDGPRWASVEDRSEVRAALAGTARATHTRIRDQRPAVLLFLASPIRHEGGVIGAVYVVRSTTPVLEDLHRIRSSLARLLAIALSITVATTLLLALSITRPLARLARRARRVASGERDLPDEPAFHGEIAELSEAFTTMTTRLDERLVYARDFAADVAHELKSPLTSIRGAAELLEEGADDDPVARKRFLRNIVLDVERMNRLVSGLLELGRIEASGASRVPVDLVALARRVAARAASPDVAVVVAAEALAILELREGDIEAALQNVVENAVRHSKAGDTVQVRVGNRNGVFIEVEDHGGGIAEADLARVFDRFFTTDGDREGTGLGLAIAKSAMETHGGRVTLASTLGEGTMVTFRFSSEP